MTDEQNPEWMMSEGDKAVRKYAEEEAEKNKRLKEQIRRTWNGSLNLPGEPRE